MKYALAIALFVLLELAMYDIYTHALTTEGFLQGWIAVGFHAASYALTWVIAWWFRDLQRA